MIKTSIIAKGTRATGIGVIGLWLLLLYPLFIFSIVATLGSYQFQEKISRSESKLSISVLLQKAGNIKSQEELLVNLNEQLSGINKSISNTESEIVITRSEYKSVTAMELKKLIELSKYISDKYPSEDSSLGPIVLAKKYEASDSNLKALLEEYEKIPSKYDSLKNKLSNLETVLRNYEINQKTTNEFRSSIDIKLIAFKKEDNIGEFVDELNYMTAFNLETLATMPRQMLVILLTLSMGALGSLLFITQDYFNSTDNKPFSWYLFRPFLGMVTAVAILVLAKAGQITISDAGASNGMKESLNPFFISFIAIISGLLSEHAIEKIRKSAIPFLSIDERKNLPSRWGVGLNKAIKEKNADIKHLEIHLDKSNDIVSNWINEKEPVPFEEQRIISSWLNIPLRELFTDVKPHNK